MKREWLSVLLVLTMTGCASAPQPAAGTSHPLKEWVKSQSRAKRGAMIGAAAGALFGAATALLTGGDTESVLRRAAAGAVVGGVAGYVIGKRQDNLYGDRDAAVRARRYTAQDGFVVMIDEVTVAPPVVKPGETATITIRYTAISPDQAERIPMRVYKGLKYDNSYLAGDGPAEFTVQGGGIVTSSMEFTPPSDAPAGTYSIEAVVEDKAGRKQAVGSGVLLVNAA